MDNPKVNIVEVGPRDGLQNETTSIATETKLELIQRLAGAGLKTIEATAFVSPKRIPQMADNQAVMAGLDLNADIRYPVLVPNLQGLEAAIEAGAKEIAIFTATSDSFTQKNIQCTVAESIQRFIPVINECLRHNIAIRGYLSTVIDCPYEGPITPARTADIAQQLLDLGCYQISLGDTIGTGTPERVKRMLVTVQKNIPAKLLAGHFHDTYGMGIANIYAAWQMGITTFDASVGGLGGCPYAPGASGNVATEDVLWLMQGLGVETGVDLDQIVQTALWISHQLGRPLGSKTGRARAITE
ncbi:hydroxymethylglutaryl-CoA lyase [Leeia sp. TBRC 13508]|uniref:Hydroxymethylglutaryl-CoA lyase n=1 Tax=Leeia speluncae TaxID=2884804 RepID=A0ABS8D8Z6_9NEIS|nr:hydroxymethylglutaryl-CoA lyase [Leeia speluncae]MCB6184665.1 hydroxymethylglutaryl-CoA lyase [Leeia speluncae]